MPSHSSNVGVHPLNGDARNTTMVLDLSMSGHKHLHESNHSNSDKGAINIVDPLKLELVQGNIVIVSCTYINNKSSKCIDVHKKKEKKTFRKTHDHSWAKLPRQ